MDRSGGPARSPRTIGLPISRQSAKSRCRQLAHRHSALRRHGGRGRPRDLRAARGEGQVMSLLQSIAPPRLVNEWALTGEPFDAGAAQSAGLLNYVVPAAELDAKIEWLIGRIVDKSPTAMRRGKYAMRAIASMSFDQSIAYTESQIALLAMTEDAREGLKAFSEKRKPSWVGKIARLTSSSQLSLGEPQTESMI
jgi:enoyl-CoA hydratase/isomerase-like protein